MPVFQLSDEVVFPSPELARKDGLLAFGGDLSEERLLLAYSMGIFPWYSEASPILWWSPDPRMILISGLCDGCITRIVTRNSPSDWQADEPRFTVSKP